MIFWRSIICQVCSVPTRVQHCNRMELARKEACSLEEQEHQLQFHTQSRPYRRLIRLTRSITKRTLSRTSGRENRFSPANSSRVCCFARTRTDWRNSASLFVRACARPLKVVRACMPRESKLPPLCWLLLQVCKGVINNRWVGVRSWCNNVCLRWNESELCLKCSAAVHTAVWPY